MTQLQIRKESWGGGDQRWLASSWGADHPRTATIDPQVFKDKFKDGVLRAGEALALVDGLAVPYDKAATGGAQILAGFLFTDQSPRLDGGLATVPFLDVAKVRLSRLPSPVAADATTTGTFNFIEGA